MTTLRVIGLTGPKGVGKTTFAQKLAKAAKRRGWSVVRVGFADAIRASLCGAGVRPGVIGLDKDKPFRLGDGATGRDLLIALGMYMREKDPDHWVKAWSAEVGRQRELFAASRLLVIADDVRFGNEAAAVRYSSGRATSARHGYVVALSREGVAYSGGDTETPVSLPDIGCDVERRGTVADVLNVALSE